MLIKPTNETLISDLELSVRTANCLLNTYREANGWQPFEPNGTLPRPKVKDLRHIPDENMLKNYNFGKKSLAEWKHILWLVDEPEETAASNEYRMFQELRDTLSRIDTTRKELGSFVSRARDLVDTLEKLGASNDG
jgi:hypothetical protein